MFLVDRIILAIGPLANRPLFDLSVWYIPLKSQFVTAKNYQFQGVLVLFSCHHVFFFSHTTQLVGGLELFFPIYWECHHPNWLAYFWEGWLNHQPDNIVIHIFLTFSLGYPMVSTGNSPAMTRRPEACVVVLLCCRWALYLAERLASKAQAWQVDYGDLEEFSFLKVKMLDKETMNIHS